MLHAFFVCFWCVCVSAFAAFCQWFGVDVHVQRGHCHSPVSPTGHPSSDPGFTCATINAAKASKWESNACNKKLGYICRRGNSTSLPAPPSNFISNEQNLVYYQSVFTLQTRSRMCSQLLLSLCAVKDQHIFCPSHWVPYAGHCYYLERSKKMWKDALTSCRKEGGDLASIHNIEEQSFIISQSGYCKSFQSHIHVPFNHNKSEFTNRSERGTSHTWVCELQCRQMCCGSA